MLIRNRKRLCLIHTVRWEANLQQTQMIFRGARGVKHRNCAKTQKFQNKRGYESFRRNQISWDTSFNLAILSIDFRSIFPGARDKIFFIANTMIRRVLCHSNCSWKLSPLFHFLLREQFDMHPQIDSLNDAGEIKNIFAKISAQGIVNHNNRMTADWGLRETLSINSF